MNIVPDKFLREIGVDPEKEMGFWTVANQIFLFPRSEVEPGGTSYVRFVDKEGVEKLYYDADEWSESREQGEEVMGSILGCMVSGANFTDMRPDPE
jgi:hypothetical protein